MSKNYARRWAAPGEQHEPLPHPSLPACIHAATHSHEGRDAFALASAIGAIRRSEGSPGRQQRWRSKPGRSRNDEYQYATAKSVTRGRRCTTHSQFRGDRRNINQTTEFGLVLSLVRSEGASLGSLLGPHRASAPHPNGGRSPTLAHPFRPEKARHLVGIGVTWQAKGATIANHGFSKAGVQSFNPGAAVAIG